MSYYQGIMFVLLIILTSNFIKAEDSRPNIIVIQVGDMGYECVGVNGCKSYETPHLDRLAKSGARFNHCYSQPAIDQTRTQVLTGQYNVRNFIREGLLNPESKTFANLCQEAGYRTMMAGKWNFGCDYKLPRQFGFQEYCLNQIHKFSNKYRNPVLESNSRVFEYNHDEFGPDILNDYVLQFISRTHTKPWLVYYSMFLTQEPFVATPDDFNYFKPLKNKGDEGYYGEKGLYDNMQYYYKGFVQYTDKLVGKLLDELEATHQLENTLIIFLSSNGTSRGINTETTQGKISGERGHSNTIATHIPLIISWPDKIKKSQVFDQLVDTTDLLPTICDAADISLSGDITMDGFSLLPLMQGKQQTVRESSYCWFGNAGSQKPQYEFARTTRYKLHTNDRFYDTQADPQERNTIALDKMNAEEKAAYEKLKNVLKSYEKVRPDKLKK